MHPPHRMRRSPGSKLAALIAILAVGWLTLHSEALARPRLTADSLAAPGPFAVGITTLTLVDPSRPTAASGAYAGSPVRTLVTDVYYPSTTGGRGAPLDPSGGPFPLLVFAHGLGGARTNFAATLTHLASRGYVVVAPDFPLTGLVNFLTGTVSLADLANQPGDVSFEIDTFTGSGAPAGAPFAAAVDRARVGLLGHSYGGGTVMLSVFGGPLADPRVRAAAAAAPFSCPFGSDMFRGRKLPFLILHGTSDLIVDPAWSLETFAFMPAPKLLIDIVGGDHLGFVSDPTIPAFRDTDVLPLFTTVLQSGLPGGQLAQFAALAAALSVVPGADPARCVQRPSLPDPSAPHDPLLAHDQQLRITDVALTAFMDAFVRRDGAARRFILGFRRRARFGSAVRVCKVTHGRRTCRSPR